MPPPRGSVPHHSIHSSELSRFTKVGTKPNASNLFIKSANLAECRYKGTQNFWKTILNGELIHALPSMTIENKAPVDVNCPEAY